MAMDKLSVSNFLLALDKYVMKRGKDNKAYSDLSTSIGNIIDIQPGTIVVNNLDNCNIPDIAVVHSYGEKYFDWLMNADTAYTNPPYGYMIEISDRCFDKYTTEELGALIMHDLLHNVCSDTAKLRFMKSWYEVINQTSDIQKLQIVKMTQYAHMLYLAMFQICITPFQAPVKQFDYVAADEPLKYMGLADAYDSYLEKARDVSNDSVDDYMVKITTQDNKTMKMLLSLALDGQEPGYMEFLHKSIPLISLGIFLGVPREIRSHARHSAHVQPVFTYNRDMPISESFNNPSTDYDIRFSIDKIINSMRYAETESERDVILFRIKQLSLKIIKIREKLEKTKSPSNTINKRIMLLQEYEAELEELRKKTVEMEIKEKRWSIYVKGDMPEGYDM